MRFASNLQANDFMYSQELISCSFNHNMLIKLMLIFEPLYVCFYLLFYQVFVHVYNFIDEIKFRKSILKPTAMYFLT